MNIWDFYFLQYYMEKMCKCMDSFTGYNHSHNLSVQYNLSVPSVDVTCDDLDEFSCADGRECILKGIQQLHNSKYQISQLKYSISSKTGPFLFYQTVPL